MSEPENPCARCGEPAPVFELVGAKVPMRFCEKCSEIEAREEEARERAGILDRALRRAGATPRLLAQTLDSHPEALHVATARAWLRDYRAGDARNLYVRGPVGTGKTGLAWGIVRELAVAAVDDFFATDEVWRPIEPAVPAGLVRWADLLDLLKAAFDADRRGYTLEDDPLAGLDRAKRVPVLALDDLGRERPTPYAVEKLANLVEERYQRRVPTIVTSNYNTAELAARLGAETGLVDGERIVSRLVEDAVGVAMEGPSRRRAA